MVPRGLPAHSDRSRKNTEAEIETTGKGFRLATSVGGPLTGRGGNLVIIDDPMKPSDAYSEPKRSSVCQWYETTLLSRLDHKGEDVIIVVTNLIATRAGRGELPGSWSHNAETSHRRVHCRHCLTVGL